MLSRHTRHSRGNHARQQTHEMTKVFSRSTSLDRHDRVCFGRNVGLTEAQLQWPCYHARPASAGDD